LSANLHAKLHTQYESLHAKLHTQYESFDANLHLIFKKNKEKNLGYESLVMGMQTCTESFTQTGMVP
jgi:hypothetical protein